MIFSNIRGSFINSKDFSEEDLISEVNLLGAGEFPYKELERKYEACESFKIFDNKQHVVNEVKFPHADLLKYTFGLEFETSMGYIPEELIFRDGLIPLRDGSISGLEYSTVVLNGNDGLNLLKQEIGSLRQYTAFNKECSLHIHFGGYPLRSRKLFNLYKVCLYLQESGQLQRLVPEYTFKSSKYKKSGKDYCNKLPIYDSFEDLYYALVGTQFDGSFRTPHPADPDRHHKWNIHTRYYWVNFINFMCYDVNKTIEFRLLRPTFNLRKIQDWIYIFNAILLYSEKLVDGNKIPLGLRLKDIFNEVYPADFAKTLSLEVKKLEVEKDNQTRNEDYCGSCLQFEDMLFNSADLL